jgi:fatty-acyl-CoA synthase
VSDAAIQDYCRRHLAYFKVPHFVRFVDAFPMTVTGKVQKYLMREAMVAELAEKANA